LKAVKTILEVPKLRDQLPKTNQQGMDFKKFTQTLGQIYKNTVNHLFDKSGIPESLSETNSQEGASPKRQNKISKSIAPFKRGSDIGSSSR
jgi:hypothetical protein